MTSKPDGDTSIDELVAVYHRYVSTGAATDFWAWDRVGEIVRGPDPERAWDLVAALVHASSDDRLGYVGAGPVEDLVNHHGASLIDWIVGEAKRDPRFCEALASIWLVQEDVPPEVLRRTQEATGGRIRVATQAQIAAATPPHLRDP